MQPWIKWCFILFNLAVLVWLIWIALVDARVLPGYSSTFGILGRFFMYEMTALIAIMVNLFLGILAVMMRR